MMDRDRMGREISPHSATPTGGKPFKVNFITNEFVYAEANSLDDFIHTVPMKVRGLLRTERLTYERGAWVVIYPHAIRSVEPAAVFPIENSERS